MPKNMLPANAKTQQTAATKAAKAQENAQKAVERAQALQQKAQLIAQQAATKAAQAQAQADALAQLTPAQAKALHGRHYLVAAANHCIAAAKEGMATQALANQLIAMVNAYEVACGLPVALHYTGNFASLVGTIATNGNMEDAPENAASASNSNGNGE